MTPRLLVLIVTVIILLFAFLHPTNLAEHDSQPVKLEEPQVWPTIVADPNPAYARLAFLAALRPRARSAPTKRTTMRAASAGAPVVTESSVNGYPCGGTELPPCYVMRRESGGNPNAYNARGCNGHGCYGLWQFSGAWACHFGLSCDIAHWTPDEQTSAARQLWNHGRGCTHWAAC